MYSDLPIGIESILQINAKILDFDIHTAKQCFETSTSFCFRQSVRKGLSRIRILNVFRCNQLIEETSTFYVYYRIKPKKQQKPKKTRKNRNKKIKQNKIEDKQNKKEKPKRTGDNRLQEREKKKMRE